MQTTIKPIETVYKGYRFRSRLEARWAVFFDTLGIEWEYEPEGYKIGLVFEEWKKEQRWYLPDFHFPKLKSWVEVKGDADNLDFNLLVDAVDWSCGLPDMAWSMGDNRGLLVLGPIPYMSGVSWKPAHPILQHYKGAVLSLAVFVPGGIEIVEEQLAWFDSTWGDQSGLAWTSELKKYFRGEYGKEATEPIKWAENLIVKAAYTAARSARFEYGERGC